VLVHDATGRLTTWIELGAPDADRLHHASKLAARSTIYTHRDPQKVIAAWAGKRIAHPVTLEDWVAPRAVEHPDALVQQPPPRRALQPRLAASQNVLGETCFQNRQSK
jgi:hypothetical protein